MKRTALTLPIFSALAVTACSRNSDIENVPFYIGDKRITKALIKALDEKGLKYEIVDVFGTETIIWGEEDNESIQSTLSELPIGRA